jgi:hypothetical protein
MNRNAFLSGVGHQARAVFFMVGALVFYCFWLSLITWLGWVSNEMSSQAFAALLLAPFLPVCAFDLWLRIGWAPGSCPPSLRQKLLQREYGLCWFPVLICISLWVWGSGLTGLAVWTWLKDVA